MHNQSVIYRSPHLHVNHSITEDTILEKKLLPILPPRFGIPGSLQLAYKNIFPVNWCINNFSSLLLRTCLHGGRKPHIGEVTYVWSPHQSCKRAFINIRDYMNRRVTPPKRVTSPTCGPLPPCKQALNYLLLSYAIICSLPCIKVFFSSIYQCYRTMKKICINIYIKLTRVLFQL